MDLENRQMDNLAKSERRMTEWTKWSLLRAIASAGHNAEAFRPFPTEFLRIKLLKRVSTREAQHYLNKTDTYVLNTCAVKNANAELWLEECGNLIDRPRVFPRRDDSEK